jgi:DNA ligase (NAD+)
MTAPKKLVATAATAGPLSGKTLVVTGTLEKYTRQEIEELIEQHGGRAASSVSKSTDYLVAGEKAGSKLDKARKLNVRVISESEFEQLIAPSV